MNSDKSIDAYAKQIKDRFGELPQETKNLINVVKLRNLGSRLGFEKIIYKNKMLIAFFVKNQMSPYYKSKTFSDIIEKLAGINGIKLSQSDKGMLKIVTKEVLTLDNAYLILSKLQ